MPSMSGSEGLEGGLQEILAQIIHVGQQFTPQSGSSDYLDAHHC